MQGLAVVVVYLTFLQWSVDRYQFVTGREKRHHWFTDYLQSPDSERGQNTQVRRIDLRAFLQYGFA